MFFVQFAPLGGILGPLKSDLGLICPFRAIYSIYNFFKVKFLGMVNVWLIEFFFQFLKVYIQTNEAPKLIWLTHLGAENIISFKL